MQQENQKLLKVAESKNTSRNTALRAKEERPLPNCIGLTGVHIGLRLTFSLLCFLKKSEI
jgi:hypothetical protein